MKIRRLRVTDFGTIREADIAADHVLAPKGQRRNAAAPGRVIDDRLTVGLVLPRGGDPGADDL